MTAPRLLAAFGVALAVGACGSSEQAAQPAATPSPGPERLLAVHDALVGCLNDADVGVTVSYRDGEAVVGESFRQPKFDSRLAAPEAAAVQQADGAG